MKASNNLTLIVATLFLTACDDSSTDKTKQDISAIPLALQTEHIGILTTNPSHYEQLYRYTSSVGQTITLRISSIQGPIGGGSNSALDTNIRTSNGRIIDIKDVLLDHTAWMDIVLSAGETLYVDISSYGTFRDEFYKYEIEVLPSTQNALIQDEIDFEPNDTINISVPMALNTVNISELLTGSIDLCDTYQLTLAGGINYSLTAINLFGPSSSTVGGLQFSIIDIDNNPVILNFDLAQNLGKNIEFSVNTPGHYYLQACSPAGMIYQNSYYKYQFAVHEPREIWDDKFDGDNYEPNDSAGLAYEIDVSELIVSNLEIGPTDFIDSYKVKIYPGNKYELNITATNGPNRSNLSNLRVSITDRAGERILAPETPISLNETKEFTLESLIETDAIIKIYYQPTTGHELDYHEYQLEIIVI